MPNSRRATHSSAIGFYCRCYQERVLCDAIFRFFQAEKESPSLWLKDDRQHYWPQWS